MDVVNRKEFSRNDVLSIICIANVIEDVLDFLLSVRLYKKKEVINGVQEEYLTYITCASSAHILLGLYLAYFRIETCFSFSNSHASFDCFERRRNMRVKNKCEQ